MILDAIKPDALHELTDDQFRDLMADAVALTAEDRKQNQILFYSPNSARQQEVMDCCARIVGVGGGNRSGKTEVAMVDMVMCATGVFPHSQRHLIKSKFRGPIQCRMVVESLTTTLEPIILPKLMWWRWDGIDQPGGARGHWGWIPKASLIDGEWDRSWSAKLRMLRLLCRDPENPDRVIGESSIQFMSFDQDPTDFASGNFHIIVHDEPPKLAQWRENEARIMGVAGRMLLAMTWPDDPSINVDWLYNEVYEPGKTGNVPDIKWFELWTTENKLIDQAAVAAQAGKWSNELNQVRIYGRPIRFSNRIHPIFTDNEQTWCYPCGKSVIPVPQAVNIVGGMPREVCSECGSEQISKFNHVDATPTATGWPTVMILDPHPRKDHVFLWVQITPQDDWIVVADGHVDGDCTEVKKEIDRTESDLSLWVVKRITDPNMGQSPAGQKRGVTWRDEFAAAGLDLDLANDSSVGRQRINTMLHPDPRTLQPRLKFHPRCRDTIYEMMRYSWDNYAKNIERDVKQQPKDTYSDRPSCLKYFANLDITFRLMKDGAPVLHTRRAVGSR